MNGRIAQAEWVLGGGIRPLQSFKAHERGITSVEVVAYTARGERDLLATISEGLDAKIWDVAAMKCAATFSGHRERVTCVTCAANTLFTGSTDRTVRVWSLMQGGTCTAVLRGHTDSVTCLAADSIANWLVSGAHDGSLRVWHIPAQVCVAVFGGTRASVGGRPSAVFPRCLVMDEERAVVYCGLQTGELQLWNLHQHLVPLKRPSLVNRTKPKLLLPGKDDELVQIARNNVTLTRSDLRPISQVPFDTWEDVPPNSQRLLLPGYVYSYTLKAKNFGAPLKAVVIKDMLESGMNFVECRPAAAAVTTKREFNGRITVHWHIENLGVAKEAEAEFYIRADKQGKVARPLKLMRGEGLAVMRMKILGGLLHCGFQGGNVVRLTVKFDQKTVRLAQMFKHTPPDDDPWAVEKQVPKPMWQRLLLCCATCVLCRLCVRSLIKRCKAMCSSSSKYRVKPLAQGKKPIAAITDTHYLNQMTGTHAPQLFTRNLPDMLSPMIRTQSGVEDGKLIEQEPGAGTAASVAGLLPLSQLLTRRLPAPQIKRAIWRRASWSLASTATASG